LAQQCSRRNTDMRLRAGRPLNESPLLAPTFRRAGSKPTGNGAASPTPDREIIGVIPSSRTCAGHSARP
jgi:hypothetical protein